MAAPVEKPQTLMECMRHFTPDVAEQYVQSIKWSAGPCCPKCGSVDVVRMPNRARMHRCREKACRKQFSLITGTIMEATHLRLDQWVVAVWMIVGCRNGVSSHEIARTIGCKQLSAWHLLHRVRYVMAQTNDGQLGERGGVCEADWTYVGGLLKFMSYKRAQRAKAKKNFGKAIVHAIKERRTGMVRARVIPGATRKFIRGEIRGNVARKARLYTDEAQVYTGSWTEVEYQHDFVTHSLAKWGRGNGQYVKGTIHTNGCENFFNCLRRALKGTYIRATPEHLQPYVDEQVFRFNHRKDSEWERFDAAMRLIVGKRLSYSTLTGGAVR
jgi:hypothetical protein